MRRLVFTGHRYEFRPDEKPLPPPHLGDTPRILQQPTGNARVYKAVFGSLKERGNGYRPGPLRKLAHDQCKYTIHGFTMCGAKVCKGAWCALHLPIVYPARRRFMEAAE